MAESIVLDPSEVASSRTALDITPWLDDQGLDWGDAEIQAYLAESQKRGENVVDFRVPNRQVQGGLVFDGTSKGGTASQTARANIQAKLSLIQQEGGWLKRITASGGTVYADIVNASLTATSVSGWESRGSIDQDAHFELDCIPDFYGDETTLSDHTETTANELVFTETSVAGDFPGRVRIVVDDDQGIDQRGLIWSWRSKNYSSAATAKTFYEAEALQNLDTARILAGTTITGSGFASSGGTVVSHGTVSTNWTPIVGTNIGGTSFLTHTGTNRVWARVFSTSGTLVQSRFVWDVGDLVSPAENESFRLPGASNFYLVDYGEVRLDPAPVGTHRWQGQIQAKGDVGTEQFAVDKVWIVNQDEGAGVLTAPIPTTLGLATYSARSEFNTESGAITGDTLAVGGTWAGAGDSDDFTVAAGVATRAQAGADTSTSVANGRLITASTPTLTNVVVRVDLKLAGPETLMNQGVIARWTDTSNFAGAYVACNSSSLWNATVFKRVAGTSTSLVALTGVLPVAFDSFYTLQMMVTAAGSWFVWMVPQGGSLGTPIASGQDSALATGGTLATGKVGILDWCTSVDLRTRTYDNFAAWAPTPDAVTFASRSTQLTTQGQYRLDSSGSAYGPVAVVSGDLPRIPPAGLEGRTTELFLKASRGDLAQLPDGTAADDLSARISYRPSYLFVP